MSALGAGWLVASASQPADTEPCVSNSTLTSNEPNPFFGADRLPGRGNSFENSPRLHLVDAGMSNNTPQHVFMHVRPISLPFDTSAIAAYPQQVSQSARDVDLILLFDASSDVQKGAALERINEYGSTRGIEFAPRREFEPLVPLESDEEGRPMELSEKDMRVRFEGR